MMMSSHTTSLNGRGSDSCSLASGAWPPTPLPVSSSSSSPAYVEQLRQRLTSGLQTHPELCDLLGLCAESNDWTVEEARQRPDSIVVMELFLLQVHRVPLLQYFPNLVTVKLMSIGLESIADFASLTNVEELWLSDNSIRVIEGLDNMTKLRRLYLQGNCITSLEGLPPLRHLRELWIARNQLCRLTHLTPLRKLRALYAAENPISVLDGAFSMDMTHLHDVNLSGCHIADIAQLCYLQQLPCLRHVWFSDPLFGDNAICRMNNYTTLALAMLDSLDSLDGVFVTAEQRSLVESILGKKKSYYEMRAQMLETNLVLLSRYAETCALREVAQNAEALAQLHACLQPIEAELAERQLYRSGSSTSNTAEESGTGNTGSLFRAIDSQATSPSTPTAAAAAAAATTPAVAAETEQLESTRRKLARAVGTCEILEQKALLQLAQATNAAAAEARLLRERLAVELHTAGNVRLEPVNPTHETYTSVDALVQARFDRALFEQQFGVTGVVVTGVRRIVNRGRQLRFDSRVKELHVDLSNLQHRSRFVGLFGVVPTSQEGQSACLQYALLYSAPADDDSGVASSVSDTKKKSSSSLRGDPYTPTPADEGIPLTDSLFYADEARLRALSCGSSGGGGSASPLLSQVLYRVSSGNDNVVACHGQLVLYRTYLGKAVSALGDGGSSWVVKGSAKDNGADASSVPLSFLQKTGRVLKRDYGDGITAAYRVLPSEPNSSGTAVPAAAAAGEAAPKPTPSYVWYCFDRALVLADCVVDYYYTVAPSSPKHTSPTSSLIATPGAIPPRIEETAANALLSAVCMPCSTGSTASKDKGAAADASREVRDDLMSCAAPLLQFIHWCDGLVGNSNSNSNSNNNNGHARQQHKTRSVHAGLNGNTLKVAAAQETADAISAAASVLGNTLTSQLLSSTRHAAATSNAPIDAAARPLQAQDVEDYVARMQVSEGNLTLCVLRGCGLTAVWKDFVCPLLATVTTLDLSQNALTQFSWFAVAKEAPQLQRLNLRGNRLTTFRLDGSRLPALRSLDVSDNRLTNAADFRGIRSAAPALEELELRGNPLLLPSQTLCATQPRQEAEARLWLYLAPPPSSCVSPAAAVAHSTVAATSVKLNQHGVGSYPGTLAVQRYRRACITDDGGGGGGGDAAATTRITRAVVFLLRRTREMCSAAGSSVAAAAALFSIDGVSVPERCVDAVVRQLEQWEAAGTLDEDVAAALRDGLPSCPSSVATAEGGRKRGGDGAAATTTLTSTALQECNDCQDFCWNYGLLESVDGLVALLPNLCRVVLRGHALTNIDALLRLPRLETLNVAENHLTTLPCFAEVKSLKELVVDFNALTSLPREIGPFPALHVLSASGNQIAYVDAALFLESAGTAEAAQAPLLEALHLSHNAIADMNVIYALREVSSLLILSVMGNPCTALDPTRAQQSEAGGAKTASDDTRQYLIHILPQLKVLDGGPISAAEEARAREAYAGKINTDLLIEKAGGPPETWATVRNLNLSHCDLTEINLLESFVGLEVLQLQHNLLFHVSGLATLTCLRALDLSHNRIGAAAWRSVNGSSASASAASPTTYPTLGAALEPLKLLESLSVESNQLTDLSLLKLRLPKLKFLNARGNELQFLQHSLEYLPDLRELLLDQNKLRGLPADCFAGNKKLSILSAENNAINSLKGLRGCAKLEQLRLGANRLGELKDALTDLQTCPLKTLVLVGNHVARKSNYRTSVISSFAQLAELDRRPITPEEREKATAAARVTEFVAPPNVVIDMDFFAVGAAAASAEAIVGVGNGGLPSRNRLSNLSAAIPTGMRRGVAGTDRFSVNPRSRPYRR